MARSPLKDININGETVKNTSRDLLETVLKHKKAKKPLDIKESDFVAHYIESKNAYKSALYAGYSDDYARSRASYWVKPDIKKNPKLNVFAALHAHNQKIQRKAVNKASQKLAMEVSAPLIDAEYVKQKTVEHIEKSSGDRPTHITTRTDPKTGETVTIEHFGYEHTGVAKGLEMLAKHKDVRAFEQPTLELGANGSLLGLLDNITTSNGPPILERCDIEDGEIIEAKTLPTPPVRPPKPPRPPE